MSCGGRPHGVDIEAELILHSHRGQYLHKIGNGGRDECETGESRDVCQQSPNICRRFVVTHAKCGDRKAGVIQLLKRCGRRLGAA